MAAHLSQPSKLGDAVESPSKSGSVLLDPVVNRLSSMALPAIPEALQRQSISPHTEEMFDLAVNAYEDVLRRLFALQRALAGVLTFEPARSMLNTTADLTRDAGAVQLSTVRWLLDL